MKALTWIKEKILWILGGVGFVLGAIFAVKYEKQRIEKLKMKAQLLKKVSENERAIIYAEGKDKGLERAEQVADLKVERASRVIDQLAREVPRRSADEIADRFNAMYGHRHNNTAVDGSGGSTTP